MINTNTNPALVMRKTNVHLDDIHGICVQGNYIVSGSKDTTIKMFDVQGNLCKVISRHPTSTDTSYSYKYWVTALDVFHDDSIVGGYRNNYLICKNMHSNVKYYSNVFVKQPRNSQSCMDVSKDKGKYYKVKNQERITGLKCLTSFNNQRPYTALIGVPQKFYHMDFESCKIISDYSFNAPEWVYGFSQVNEECITAIHAGSLSLLQNQGTEWILKDKIVEEGDRLPAGQRPFISAVAPMEKGFSSHKVALAFFGGKTKIIDIHTKQVVFEGKEHTERVWQATPFSPNEYVSCADDKTIKVWDTRSTENSIFTYYEHPGRVSAIAFIQNLCFVAGTCPSAPHADLHKGQFYFYDIRKSSSISLFEKSSNDTPVQNDDNKISSELNERMSKLRIT